MFPDNTSIAVVFVAQDPQQPVANFYNFIGLLRILIGNGAGILPHQASTETMGHQQAAAYFLEKTTADNLVFLNPDTLPPDHGIELLVKQLRQQEKPGVITGLTFRWPTGSPNILTKTGTERLGGYSFPAYGPMMDTVGRWAIQHQEHPKGKPVLLPPEVIAVPYFNSGLFAVSRELLEKMNGLYFHDRQGWWLGTFCDKVRALGGSVQCAMNIVCAGSQTNHINFLENYGVKSWEPSSSQ